MGVDCSVCCCDEECGGREGVGVEGCYSVLGGWGEETVEEAVEE